MKYNLLLLTAVALVGLFLMTKTTMVPSSAIDSSLGIRFDYSPEEIIDGCKQQQSALLTEIDSIVKTEPSQIAFQSTFQKMDTALSQFGNAVGTMLFLKDVSPEAKVRDASATCSEEIGQLFVNLFAREDLYRVLKRASERPDKLNPQDRKLVEETLKEFRRNGLELPAAERAKFIERKKKIVTLQENFEKRLKDSSKQFVLLDEKELDGIPADLRGRLTRDESGKYRLFMDKASAITFMETATSGPARKRVDHKLSTLGGPENVKTLEEVTRLRHETANQLGFKTHAAYVLDDEMARDTDTAFNFLRGLVDKLKVLGKKDLQELSALKQQEGSADPVAYWDWRYYQSQWKKKHFDLDAQKVREYFPLNTVLAGMFDIYQTLLSVKFTEVTNAPKWHPEVRLYKIEKHGQTVAYFYMDLFPREGKYTHFAAFDVWHAFTAEDGKYRAPVSSIVGNFSPPSKEVPSLLSHDEVETMFHEFGHIMHQTLTRANYGSLSGTNVKRDFVEAPSQMLENWVWDPAMLKKISGHYKNESEKLPDDLIKKMLDAKNAVSSIFWLRQATFALIDLTYHTTADLTGKSTKIYADTMRDTMMLDIQKDTIPQASFGHLMGGYDAGYYGYLWSKVFAEDMFTRFEKEGLLNSNTGGAYLSSILEPGGTREPMDLVKEFLGREPNSEAFLKSLGI